ncbi:hypothetical protein O0L34_g557 [Tuta absoluta]|nr:hypothetical protein O0L34_g557 [Tuta absoluta]
MDLASIFSYILNVASIALPEILKGVKLVVDVPEQAHEDQPVKYYNAQVWRTSLRSTEDIKMFRTFLTQGDVSVWKMKRNIVDYLVPGENVHRMQRVLRKKRLNHDVMIADVQKKIDATKPRPSPWSEDALRKGHRLNFHSFPDNQVIDEFLDNLGAQYPSITKVRIIGRSTEKRDIKMIRISNGNPDNKVMLLVGGQHAREWAGIVAPLYIANNIVTKFDEQPSYVKNKDWYIIPVLNPDGYEFTQTKDRLWRKTRRPNPDVYCPGTDLNRNYPFHWDLEGVTIHNYCSEEYAGSYALSEPEARALVGLYESMGKKKPSAYLDFHAYGQYIVYPWSSVKTPSPHKITLQSTGNKIKEVIQHLTGRSYTVGSTPDLLYLASGSSIDYIHSEGVRHVYAFEVRDTLNNEHGFLMPPDEIEGVGKEMLAAARIVAEAIDEHVKIKRKWF